MKTSGIFGFTVYFVVGVDPFLVYPDDLGSVRADSNLKPRIGSPFWESRDMMAEVSLDALSRDEYRKRVGQIIQCPPKTRRAQDDTKVSR